jgi:hypothetical protein
VVVVDGDTVKLFPVPTRVPPHEPVYQARVGPLPLGTLSTVVDPAQIEDGVAVAVVGFVTV